MPMPDAFVPSACADADWLADERDAVPALTYDRSDALDAVLDAYLDARASNWDGYGAAAVSAAAVERACRFVLALPDGTPEPEPEASPRGSIQFTWYAAPTRRLTVDVAGSGHLAYAALLGQDERRRGTDRFTDTVPSDLLSLAAQVVRRASWGR